MDLLKARVALRERGLLDTIDLAIRFLAAERRALAPAVLFCIGALLAPIALLSPEAASVVVSLLAPIVSIPCTLTASRLVFAPRAPFAPMLREMMKFAFPVLVVCFAYVTVIGLGLFVLGIPTIIFGVGWMFGVEVLLLERSGPMAALGRSRRLIAYRFGDAFLALLALLSLTWGCMAIAVLSTMAATTELLQLAPLSLENTDTLSRVSLVGTAIFAPLVTIARFFVYLEFRTRTEGWDVQARFSALAARYEAERESA